MVTVVIGGLGWIALILAAVGSAYTVMAGVFVLRFFNPLVAYEPVVQSLLLLKPLHGAEAGLRRNLESFFRQNVDVGIEIVFGVQNPGDPALQVVEALKLEHPTVATKVCVNAEPHGQNRKVANLINMATDISGDVVVLSDSDIGVSPDYLKHVTAVLAAPGVGVVTCPYFGKVEAGFWSEIAAAGLSYQFLPNVITGVSLGMANPCMGSTIALRRDTLERIGGFQAFQDVLADDYAIGAAVRAVGLNSVVAPELVSHSCTEGDLAAVFAHELRWAKTVKGVDPAGHAGSIVTHPLPLACLAVVIGGFSIPSLMVLAAAFAVRVWLMGVTDRVIGRRLGPWWLIPMRDMLSFSVFVGSFFARSVEWRGVKFHVSADGDLKPV